MHNVRHPFTGLHFTEKGLDLLEQYIAEVRDVIGDGSPARDRPCRPHLAAERHPARQADREIFSGLARGRDPLAVHRASTSNLQTSTSVPICTGEDIYLKEDFMPLLRCGGVSVIHPDLLTSGGILETKKIGDAAQDHGVAMAIHMAESPIAAMAAAHVAMATENFMALEHHSADVDWWDDIVTGLPKPLVKNGFITVPDKPGLGIDDVVDEVISLICSRVSAASGSRRTLGRRVFLGSHLELTRRDRKVGVSVRRRAGIGRHLVVRIAADEGHAELYSVRSRQPKAFSRLHFRRRIGPRSAENAPGPAAPDRRSIGRRAETMRLVGPWRRRDGQRSVGFRGGGAECRGFLGLSFDISYQKRYYVS